MRVRLLLLFFFALLFTSSKGQLIQGTIKPGATTQVEVWLKPDFSNSTQYLFQLGLPVAFPSNVASEPTGVTIALDPGFISQFGNNYSVTVNPVAQSTDGTEKYFNIVLIRGGTGASNPQSWASDIEYKILTATFTYSGAPATFQAKLVDYQDAGSDGQGNFYTQDGSANYYVTSNSIGNFYASPGNSLIGGNSSAGYAQLLGAVTPCNSPPAAVVSNITTSTADINWSAVSGTTGYEYVLSTSATPPASGTATAATTVNATGLDPCTIYYFHVRSVCGAGNFSAWTTTTFTTSNSIVGAITGTTTVCIDATTQLSSTTSGGVWSSDNTAVATVGTDGLVSGIAAGTATISYGVTNSCGTTTVTATVTVNPNTNAGTVSGTSPLCTGASATYTSNGDAGGIWSSTNTSVATVNASGLVNTTGAGTTNITYTILAGCGGAPLFSFQELIVNTTPSVAAITGTTSASVGTTTQLANTTVGGVWSSDNTAVATVDGSGLVTGVSIGTAIISYAVTNSCGTETVTTVVTIGDCEMPVVAPITGASVICTGSSTQLSNTTPAGTWSSDNTSVATVDASGLVTAVSAGTATISYAVTNSCGTTTVTATVTVNTTPSVAAITGTASTSVGTTTQLANTTVGGVWSSDNTAVATVDGSGLVTGVSIGTATISYAVTNSCGTETVTTVVTIGDCEMPVVASITGASAICTGSSTQLSNTTPAGVWSSDNTSVATVDASGLVTAVSAGTATISYAVTNSCGTTTVTATVTVNGPVNAGTVSGSSPVCIGATNIFTSDGTTGGVWSSTNTAVATVNEATGEVTAVSAGTTDITYTINTGCGSPASAFQTLVVNTTPSVAAITGTMSALVGATTQLANTTVGGVWSSDNTAVATVDGSGLVTGVSIGTATISYAVTNSCGTETATTVVTIGQVTPSLIQGTIKPGAASNQIEVWLKPDFDNSTKYLFQLGFPIAFPAGATPQPTNLDVTLDPGFVAAFGNNYTVTVNPVAQNTSGTEKYFNIVLIRGGTGASDAQTWVAGTEFKVLTASFISSSSPGTPVKLADYQDGGSDGQGNFYTQSGLADYYITPNSVGNFYASPGLSVTGGTAAEGYAQTIATIGGCSMPEVASITGSSAICTGSSTQLSNTTPAGVWSSDNTGVATVDASGSVTAVMPGTATISYAVTNSCGTTTVTHVVTVNQTFSSSFTASACNDYTLPWGGSVTTSGAYTHTYQAVNGCDSVVTANVTINTSSSSTTTVSICTNQLPYNWNNNSYNAAGTYTVQLTNAAGCDSAATLVLQVGDAQTSSADVSACDSYTLPWGGSVTTSGDHTHTYTTAGGCDSVVTYHVTIYNSTSSSFDIAACDTYVLPWGGSVMTSGDYAHIYQTIHGCDSVVTAHVTINASSSSTTTVAICANELPYNWNSNSYNAGGAYTVHFTNAAGCDSAATLVLTVNDSPTLTTTAIASACGAASADLNTGISSNTGGLTVVFYSDAGLTTVIPATVNAAGTYYVQVTNTAGCSSSGSIAVSFGSSLVLTTTSLSIDCNTGSVNLNNGITSSTAGLTVTFYSDAALTNVIPATVTLAGTYYVKVTDAGNCFSSAGITVTATDTQNPVINCTRNISTSTSTCTKSVATAKPVYSDNCAVASLTWTMSGATSASSPATGINFVGTRIFNAGITTIIYTVTDASGNTATCSFTVTVKEGTKPTITCLSNIIQYADAGLCTKTLTLPDPSVNDNCEVVNVSWIMSGATTGSSPSTGINYLGTQTFNGGTTTISYVVKDASGNERYCSFSVKVIDNQAPTITCPADITEIASQGCSMSITVPTPVYGDNCGVTALTWKMTGATSGMSPTSGINHIGTMTFNTGVTTISYLVQDASGNNALYNFTVTVKDNINPVVTCPANITQPASGGKCYRQINVPNPVASDNCGPIVKLTWTMSGATTASSGSWGINYVGKRNFTAGITTVTYTATDASGNTASCSFTVTVIGSANCITTKGGLIVMDYKIRVTAFPNPSQHYFNLQVTTQNKEDIVVRIMDISGRTLQQWKGTPGKTYRFGDGLMIGTYIVEVRQGTEVRTTKVIKQ